MSQPCIICAIDREIRPLLQLFPAKALPGQADFPTWRFQAHGKSVTIIRSGIGVARATAAALQAAKLGPSAIISAGFCGALSTDAVTGEVFMAEKIHSYSSGSLSGAIAPTRRLLHGSALRKGTFITTEEIVDKERLRKLLPDPATANMLEMESASVAAVCSARGIDFAAIRSVSDTADRDPAGIFRLISDSDHNISMIKVALAAIKNPSLIQELLRLSRDTAIAGRSLAKALEQTLELI